MLKYLVHLDLNILMKKLFLLLILSFLSAQNLAGSCPDGSDPIRSISADGTYFVFSCQSNTDVDKNSQESGEDSVQNKSIFVSDEDFNDFLNLPVEDRISSCGYKGYSPNWREINKDLAPRIKGYNSKMDNWRKVEGAYSRDVLVKYLEASTYAMVSDDEVLKEKLFDKLYQWASKNALSATMQCYFANGPKDIAPACEGEWSDPDGQDLAPIKDATVAVETVMSLNYLYKLYYADYKPEDDRHKMILGWFESFYPRIKTSRDFYFGNSVGWHFPNISIKHSLDRNYKTLIENMVNGLDEWSFADGSMKDRTTRGNRALWYHSNALGEAFIILEIARIAGVEIPPTLEKKLLKAAELFNDAFLDHSVIEPWAKKRVRSQASNGRQEFNSNLDSVSFYSSWMQIFQLRYPEHRTAKWLNQELTSRAQSLKSNEITGVPIGCISKALADSSYSDSEIKVSESKTAEKVKLEPKPISDDGEIHIVDGVQYQIEGQILKVYTADSKMKPLNRNMGGLMMKCGSGLITGKKKDWLSFVSSESNDIKKARTKNCHYQYFQKSKDSEAFDLFKVISSRTDSILNQLEKK